jgi:[ribosomal protein S5]-alanine N-acetyltransferase
MKLKLQILKEKDVNQSYLDWYQDDKVIRYSNNQYRSFTIEGQKKYVKNCLVSKDMDLFGIFDKDIHIGNIVISRLSSVHKWAEITYIVGNTDYWGKGVGFFAVSEIIVKAKKIYKLNKLCAGVAEGNIASQKVLEKNNFILEGRRLKQLVFGGKFYDQLDYGLLL